MTTPLDLYTNASLLELGAEADRIRREKHPHNTVTYIVDRNINYTNVCVADCGFCAFYRRPKHTDLGAEADRIRREKHPHNTVTYIVDRNINYTNVCVADCGFCAFYRRPKHT